MEPHDIFFLVIVIILIYSIVIRIIRKIHPFPVPGFVTQLIDNPWRRRFIQNPAKITNRMEIKPGMTILEIGPGKGSYTLSLAEAVGKTGRIYAIDIQDIVINKLKDRIEKENITNIIPKIDDAYNLSFENDSIDGISMIACLPEIPNPT